MRRPVACALVACAMCVVCAGCSAASSGTTSSATSSESSSSSTAASVSSIASSEATETQTATAVVLGAQDAQLVARVGESQLRISLADNSSAEALVEKLQSEGPITVDAHDFSNFEKVGDLPWSLPTNDEQITTSAGDVILYQGNKLTIYYGQNSWNFTRLGVIEGATKDQLIAVLGDGNVSIELALA